MIWNKAWLKNIVFWIVFFFVIRLVGVTNPPVEIGHSWRQTLTNMVSRNMLEVDASLLYPRVDMIGDGTGIIGTEFPVYNYLIYLYFKFFGVNHWIGRLINLIISSVGIFFFYRIIKKFFTRDIAFNAAFVLLVSGWFGFSRKIMPDTIGVSLVLIALYYGLAFLYDKKKWCIVLFLVLGTLGALVKMPSILLFSVLLIPLFDKNVSISHKIKLSISGLIILFIMSTWYFYWVPYLVETYGYVLFYPRTIIEGLQELWINLFDTLDKFFFASMFSFIAFIFFITGVVMTIVKENKILIYVLILTSITLFFYMLKTGVVFSKHSYYIIPYTPIMALIAGFGLTIFKSKWQYILLLLISIEAIANQNDDFFLKEERKAMISWESIANEYTTPNEPIVVSGHLDPMTMYFVHRKGWSVSNETLADTSKLYLLEAKGAKYLFVNTKQYNGKIDLDLIKSYGTLNVYKLEK